MLQTRLWVGAILIALTVGMLFVDQRSGAVVSIPILAHINRRSGSVVHIQLLHLLKPTTRPVGWLCYGGAFALVAANWVPHFFGSPNVYSAWPLIAGIMAGLVILTFLVEMATFREPGSSVTRIALTVWLFGYVGLLPSFLVQLRWLGLPALANGTAALALTVFVPKCCDIGAYFAGRLLGRHRMTPVLSPKKTWEGACGGLVMAVLTAILFDRFGPAPVLQVNYAIEIGYGCSVGIAGMLGDLAESLIKRDCQQKDASQAVPGFGGVLDVVDAILFAAPVSYLWFEILR